MKRYGTILALLCLCTAFAAQAQPVRNGVDIIWARDVAGAQLTLDGLMTEQVWQDAAQIDLRWNSEHELPGSGQRTEGNPTLAGPSDPNNGTLHVLRDGNTLWLAIAVQDKSIGGGGLWAIDGLIMNLLDRERLVNERVNAEGVWHTNYFQGNRTEFFYSWWAGSDTTTGTTTYSNGQPIPSGRPVPGIGPRMAGFYGGASANDPRTPEKVAVWDARATVQGIPNDDTHGEDQGYIIEMRIDATALGYDFTKPGGDKMAWNVALQDQDYNWPVNADLAYTSRVWWQNQWGNNFNEGAAYIYGAPGVTVTSTVPQVTEPEFTVFSAGNFDAPAIDGSLDEPVWEEVDPIFHIQYQGEQELYDLNPEIAKYYVFYFRPGIGGQSTALVVDPSVARVKMLHKGQKLYVGVDVDDQAVSGFHDEGGMDGFRLFLRDRDSLTTIGTLAAQVFEFTVDSTGSVRYNRDARRHHDMDPTSVEAAVSMKGASTPVDPNDVDEGYQIEFAIDLPKVLGYPADLGDRMIWTAMNFFDGDFLDTEANSYATRTWISAERSPTGVSIYGYLSPTGLSGTATEAGADVPSRVELLGNFPNPFNPTTTLRYALPNSGEVTLHVFDVLGRQVATRALGTQPAGRQEVRFDAAGLASGVYLYRVEVKNAATAAVQSSAVGRMLLLK